MYMGHQLRLFSDLFKNHELKKIKIYDAMTINDNVLLIVPFPQAINHGKIKT